MLQLENVHFKIAKRAILRNLCLHIQPGEFVALTGANGSGKSTLFDIIAGRRGPNGGEVLFQGSSITDLPEAQRALHIGQLLQDPKLGSVGSMTVLENLCLAVLRGKRASIRSGFSRLSEGRLEELCSELSLDIAPMLHAPMGQLSGGQRQMVNFLMTVLNPPKLLLLDEPTAALDTQAAKNLLRAVVKYVRQHRVTCLMSTHNFNEVVSLTDRMVRLADGQLFEDG